MNVPPAETAPLYDDEIDLRELLLVLWRQRVLIAVVTLIAAVAAVLASLALPRVYRVEALIQMERLDNKQSVQSEGKEILESRALLTAALNQLAVQADPLTFKATGQPVKDTDYLQFSLEGRDPAQLTKVADKIVALFIDKRNQIYKERRATLEEDLHRITTDLQQSETDKGKFDDLIASLQKAPLSAIEQKIYALQLAQMQDFQAQEKVGLMQQYLTLQDKLAAMQPAKIVDGFSEPMQVRPRLALNVAVALILGLMVGVFLAFGRNWLAGFPPAGRS
ncbi:Wzz/FepE/Etk N-terminal domain-containing protein [Moorella naiadis]|uniref:Wzz/FepE/Etk N-terminal domain-containing protein n=1 Tax=Moorella naiadis (nom. illeg.) TaxID=3093670 RepID=UPI003D9CA7EA